MTERHDTTAHERLIAALNDPNHLFTADQVAYLMATAGRWSNESPAGESLAYRAAFEAGYQARIAEENAKTAEPVWSALDTKLVTQANYRKHHDEIAAQPCVGDYLGGPVDWEAKDWRNDIDPVSVQTRKLVPVRDYLNDKPEPHDWPTPAQLPADVRFIRSTTTSMGSAA